MDFGYSLGVLHHVPDTLGALRSCANKLKPGAPFLIYLYYRFDNRPRWFRLIWQASDSARAIISRLPARAKNAVADSIALTVYWPAARISRLMETLGLSVDNIPLAYYRSSSLYAMRTDALDRFGTPLEQRFTRVEIAQMMSDAGFDRVRFAEHPPYWCALGFRR